MALRNEVQESLTDAVLELIVNNYKLENSYEKVISSEGYIEDIITSGSIDNRRVLYEEDYQYKSNNTFVELINTIVDDFYIGSSLTGDDSHYPGGDNEPYDLPDSWTGYPSGTVYILWSTTLIRFQNLPSLGDQELLIDNTVLNEFSQIIHVSSGSAAINMSYAQEVLQTDIYELLPRTKTRQDEINKFFADYSRLKPQNLPPFDSSGFIIPPTTEDSYDSGSVSADKEDGYITRLDENTDEDNSNKTLQWLRDDISGYLKDLDSQTAEQFEDERPEYENQSEGYLKIRHLNQAIIIRNEESSDTGLIGPDPDNPVWQQNGFTVAMWVRFLDRVNGGTLFNLGNPFREDNPSGFVLETFTTNKNDIRNPGSEGSNPGEQTWAQFISAEQAEDEDDNTCSNSSFHPQHTYFKNNDYERFIRLVVRDKNNILRDSHVGQSEFYDEFISSRKPTHISTPSNSEINLFPYIPTAGGVTNGGDDYTFMMGNPEIAGNLRQYYWDKSVLAHLRVPVDYDEWYYVVATYNPYIIEDFINDSFLMETGLGMPGHGLGYASHDEAIYESYAPNAQTRLKYFANFWRGHVNPGIRKAGCEPGDGGVGESYDESVCPCLSGRKATETEVLANPYIEDPCTDKLVGLRPGDCVGEYTHRSGFGAKCKVEIISRSDLLRARGYKV